MNNEDYLAHHGILGMKWGIRRYRNKDGSLTDAGKKRYGKRKLKPIGEMKDVALKKISPAYRRSHMSSEELASRISRLSQEKKLKDLERDVRDERFKVGEDITKAVVKGVALATIAYIGGRLRIKYSRQTDSSKALAKLLEAAAKEQGVEVEDLRFDEKFLERPKVKDLMDRAKEEREVVNDFGKTLTDWMKPPKKK
jgi:hypothetical protein